MAKDTVIQEPEGTYAPQTDEAFPFDGPVERKKITDPTLDPGSDRWMPKKYFGLQPKVVVVLQRNSSDVLGDPENRKNEKVPVSINGYTLLLPKGVPTRVPRDFASHLVSIGAAYVYESIGDAPEA